MCHCFSLISVSQIVGSSSQNSSKYPFDKFFTDQICELTKDLLETVKKNHNELTSYRNRRIRDPAQQSSVESLPEIGILICMFHFVLVEHISLLQRFGLWSMRISCILAFFVADQFFTMVLYPL